MVAKVNLDVDGNKDEHESLIPPILPRLKSGWWIGVGICITLHW